MVLRSTGGNEDTNSQLKNKLKEIMVRVILFQQIWQLRWNGQNLWKKKNLQKWRRNRTPEQPIYTLSKFTFYFILGYSWYAISCWFQAYGKVTQLHIHIYPLFSIEKAREFQKDIHFCFIDYAKAFDCVDHSKVWKILKQIGTPDLTPEKSVCRSRSSS